MREEFTRNGATDFQRRYLGTYGFFVAGEGKKVLVQVDGVSEEQVQFRDKNKNPYTANADQGNVFEFMPVERGLYDCGDDMIAMERKPARQWKRGVCAENTSLWMFSRGDWGTVTFDRLAATFTARAKKDMETNLQDWLNGKRRGVAFTQQFGAWDGNLYLYYNKIGTITPDKKLCVVNPLFGQELKDVMRDTELNFKVEHAEAK